MLTTDEAIMFCTGCSKPFDDGDPHCCRCKTPQHKGHGQDVRRGHASAVFHVGQALQETAAAPRKIKRWRWGAAATVVGLVYLIATQSWQP
jgi:hypothetical protein